MSDYTDEEINEIAIETSDSDLHRLSIAGHGRYVVVGIDPLHPDEGEFQMASGSAAWCVDWLNSNGVSNLAMANRNRSKSKRITARVIEFRQWRDELEDN